MPSILSKSRRVSWRRVKGVGLGWDPERSEFELWLSYFSAVGPWANNSFYKHIFEQQFYTNLMLSVETIKVTSILFLSSELKQIIQDSMICVVMKMKQGTVGQGAERRW